MNCPFCKNELSEKAKFCKFCGKKIPRCPTCQRLLEFRCTFCPGDGTPIPPELTEALPMFEGQTRERPPKVIVPRQAANVHRCTKCGKPCPEGASLCGDCVSRAMGQRSSSPQRMPVQQSASFQGAGRQQAAVPKGAPDNSTKKKRFPMWVLLVLLAFVIALIVAGLWWRKLSSTPVQEAESVPASSEQLAEPPENANEPAPEASAAPGTQEPESSAAQLSGVQALPDEFYGGAWASDRRLQGLDWNTDTMDVYYVSNGQYIGAYNTQAQLQAKCNQVEGHLYSVDYHDGKVFSVMRPGGHGKFKLRIYDAATMELLVSAKLPDIQEAFSSDMDQYGTDILPCFDAIAVAPAYGGGPEMKIYISYNVYHSVKKNEALHPLQKIYEYDYDDALADPAELWSSRELDLDFGDINYGLQSLEYDPSTNRMWFAARRGRTPYSLHCMDWTSLELIKNGDQEGWKCPNSGDGFTCLGEDTFYVLVPSYGDGYASATLVKAHSDTLDEIG